MPNQFFWPTETKSSSNFKTPFSGSERILIPIKESPSTSLYFEENKLLDRTTEESSLTEIELLPVKVEHH